MNTEQIIYSTIAFFIGSVGGSFICHQILERMSQGFSAKTLLICLLLGAVPVCGALAAFAIGSRVGVLAVLGIASGVMAAVRTHR